MISVQKRNKRKERCTNEKIVVILLSLILAMSLNDVLLRSLLY